ncbi:SubName: Full=Uncharacterized protein {ECO:0000313/EMBL:CCA71987.1} [Serendipita indica DSM 11827]|uniref:Uncharacterized protein n=1 Tax=Serendipita indica (strain DSM 11827) TaxID=1109443 RepID=G4TKZ4_SERID|nr:SubName: Full=Uncharacterized protein {ECO:0000313/EMBL:CCA71987.1} [Serendipita indica DSM 11827]CCA71987.1 hypothetical protein PIIN_05922 [Serendipita indica DSM 11827]
MASVPYRDFASQGRMLVSDGGAWSAWATHSDITCTTIEWGWCGKCIQCRHPWSSIYESWYKIVLSANVSVPIDTHNRPTSLTYGFSYTLAWAASGSYYGMDLTSIMHVGNDSYLQTFQPYAYSFLTSQNETGHTISHWGTINVEDNDYPFAYVPMRIEITFLGAPYTYYFVKNPGFLITSPTGSNGLFIGSPPPGLNPESGKTQNRVGVIVGSIVGATVLALVGIFVWIRLRRRTSREHVQQPTTTPGVEDARTMANTATAPATSYYYGADESRMSTVSAWPIPSSPGQTYTDIQIPKPVPAFSGEQQQQDPPRDMSDTSSIITRPPAYDPAHPVRTRATSPPSWSRHASTSSGAPLLHRTSTVPEEVAEETGLAQWARIHRTQIPARLEAKLASAGYVPTDNPDGIPEEEWLQEYGVTKFELARVRALYQKV